MTYYYESELYHHGIKGQKWGVRRYQNEDGTLTAAGKEHYHRAPEERKVYNETLKEFGGVETKKDYQSSSIGSARRPNRNQNAFRGMEQYRKSESTGKKVAKSLLLGTSGQQTYDMARMVGESRGKAAFRSFFDVNGAGIASAAVSGIVETNVKRILDDHDLLSRESSKTVDFVIDNTVGRGTDYLITKGAQKGGKVVSLQQRALTKKYANQQRKRI